jgi:hypothetical protein
MVFIIFELIYRISGIFCAHDIIVIILFLFFLFIRLIFFGVRLCMLWFVPSHKRDTSRAVRKISLGIKKDIKYFKKNFRQPKRYTVEVWFLGFFLWRRTFKSSTAAIKYASKFNFYQGSAYYPVENELIIRVELI